jgi:hypothetical protein
MTHAGNEERRRDDSHGDAERRKDAHAEMRRGEKMLTQRCEERVR